MYLLDPMVLLLTLAAGIARFQIVQVLPRIEDCDGDIKQNTFVIRTMARFLKLYTLGQEALIPLSLSKFELFQQCRQSFYLDHRLGNSRPPEFPFSLNLAVDPTLTLLLKRLKEK